MFYADLFMFLIICIVIIIYKSFGTKYGYSILKNLEVELLCHI